MAIVIGLSVISLASGAGSLLIASKLAGVRLPSMKK